MMRIQLLFFVFLFISFILNGQISKNDIEEKNSFRQSEMKNNFKKLNANSTQEFKSDGSIDALYYEIKLDIDFAGLQITGEVTGRFRSKDNSLTQITLEFDDNLTVDSVSNNAATFTHSGYTLTINLDQTYNLDDVFETKIYYHGSPQSSGLGSFQFTNGNTRVYSLSEPYGAKDWWPCKDSPTDKPDSVDVHLTVPSNYMAISNGLLQSTTNQPGNKVTYHWHESYPIATYLVSLVAAPDFVYFDDYYENAFGDSLHLEYWVYQGELSTAQATYAEIPIAMEAMEYYFGPYPFWEERYGMARFDWGGAMEHQTITSTGSVSASWWWRHTNVHELAHQWFGDQVTCANFHHIWLNEGFASYSEALYEEYTNGSAAYHSYMQNDQSGGHSGTIFVYDTTSYIFSTTVYEKGCWVVHMLRHVVGDSIFFDILKSYTTDPRFTYGSATTEGLKTICEEISGQDLAAFFEQWIYHPSYPSYQYSWNTVPSGNKWLTQLVIKQTQTHHVYTMPIDITFHASGWDSTFVVLNDTAYQRYYIESSTEPTNVLFDKDKWILCDVSQFVDSVPGHEVFPPKTYTLYQNYPNPFNPSTSIKFYTLDKAHVEIKIYDINGREIKNISFNSPDKGVYSVDWNGTDNSGKQVSTGVYFCRMLVGGENIQSVRKMIKVN